jgi:hypothetical protein
VISSVGSNTNYFCSTPCGSSADCASAYPDGTCTTITIVQDSTGAPRTRAQLCSDAPASLDTGCVPGNGNGACHADAPVCVVNSMTDGGVNLFCAPYCADSVPACEDGLVCNTTTGTSFVGVCH